MDRLSYKTLFLAVIFLLIPIVFLLRIRQPITTVMAQWWNDSWNYRRQLEISGVGSTDLTDFQVSFNIGTSALIAAGKMNSDCSDLRLTDSNGSPLPYWIEENNPGCNQAADTKVWTKLPLLPAAGTTIYIYYGNSTAPAAQDGDQVFIFFDNFATGLSKWASPNCGLAESQNGAYHWSTSAVTGHCYAQPASNYNLSDQIIESRTRYLSGAAGLVYWGIDARFNGAGSRYVGAFYHTQGTDIRKETAQLARAGDTTFTADTWYQNKFMAVGTSLSVYRNGSLQTAVTNASYVSGGTGLDFYSSGAVSYEYDYLFVRQYASGDPSVTSSAEEPRPTPTRAVNTNIGSTTSLTSAGLVGYWQFEEGTGTTAADSSGHDNSAGSSGTLSWANGRFGKGYQFDANTKYFTAADKDNSLDFGNAITVEAWIKRDPAGLGNWNTILDKRGSSWEYWFGFSSSNQLDFMYNPGDSADGDRIYSTSAAAVLTDSAWHHVAATYDLATVRLYIDGQEKYSVGHTDPVYTGSGPVTLGNTSSTAFGFRGVADEFKIYNYARTPAQLLEDMGTGAGSRDPLIWYKLDEGAGTVINNSGIGGTLYHSDFGTGNSSPAWAESKYAKGLSFDANNDDTIFLNNNYYPNYGNFTLSAWFNLDMGVSSVSDYYPIFGNNQNVPMLGYYPASKAWSQLRQHTTNSFTITWPGTYQYADSRWHYVAVSVDQGTTAASLYLDGKLLGVQSIGGTEGYTHGNGAIRRIGRDYATSWRGRLDELKVYNYALNRDEIIRDFNRGVSAQIGQTNQTIGSTTTSLDYCIPGDTSPCSPPVSEWKFEEGSGTVVSDSSGNGIAASISNPAGWTPGKFGKALNFNGTNTGVMVTDPGTSPYDITGNITFQTWAKWNRFKDYGVLLEKGSGGSTKSMNYAIWSYSNQLTCIIADGSSSNSSSVSTSSITTNAWHHIACTADGSTLTVYVDGKAITSVNQTITPTANNYNFSVSHTNYSIDGAIDQVRIYNYARTPAQVAYDYNRGGPMGWWKFDECQGSVAYDSSGLGYTGAISIGASGSQTSLGTCQVGTSAAWTNGVSGRINSSLSFDGQDDIITAASLNLPDSHSVSAWVKPSSFANYKIILDSQNNSTVTNQYNLYLDSDGHFNTWLNSGCTSTGVLQTDTWYHLVSTYSDGTITLYLNGALDKSCTVSKPAVTTNNIKIGARTATSHPYSGQIDDLRVYSYALTPEQIRQLYTGGSVNFH